MPLKNFHYHHPPTQPLSQKNPTTHFNVTLRIVPFEHYGQKIPQMKLYSIFGDLFISYLGGDICQGPLSQTFTKPISIHYGFPCFPRRFRITFCPFQRGLGLSHTYSGYLFVQYTVYGILCNCPYGQFLLCEK